MVVVDGEDELTTQISLWLFSISRRHQWGTWHATKENCSSGPVPHFPARYWITVTKKIINNPEIVQNLAFSSVKGAGILINLVLS